MKSMWESDRGRYCTPTCPEEGDSSDENHFLQALSDEITSGRKINWEYFGGKDGEGYPQDENGIVIVYAHGKGKLKEYT